MRLNHEMSSIIKRALLCEPENNHNHKEENCMQIQILQMIEGAKKARGLTVIIDVLRAFSLECYLFDRGAKEIIAVGALEEAYQVKKEHPDYVLIGERMGKICAGCDYGNSPSQTAAADFQGKTVIHTSGAGTQGIDNAKGADELITGSLVNAKAVAEYIRRQAPEQVSLVCMGKRGIAETEEDTLCAEYIRSLLLNEPFDIQARALALRERAAKHFFDPTQQEVFPEQDFWMSIDVDRFDLVLKVQKDEAGRNVVRVLHSCE